jgi:LSD1 subclass zinc finger protein
MITCNLSNGIGYNAKTVLYSAGNLTTSCDAPGYSGSVNYTCTTNGSSATTSGSCTENGCTIPSTYTNLSSYVSVSPTSTLAYIPCATGYYDAYRTKWESVINRLPGEYDWQHTTRIFNLISGQNYTASTSNGGPTWSLGYCGLGTTMTYAQAECYCTNAPCDWHPTTTQAAGLCNCNTTRFGMHFPNSQSSSGLAYKCVKGNLYASSSCLQITCSIPNGTGYNARTVTYGSSSFNCDQAGYYGSINYNCNALNTPNLSGTCAQITCAISNGTGYSARTLNYGSSSFNCDQAGYYGSINYNCNALNTPNLSGTCTPITCAISNGTGYTGRTLNFGSGSFACDSGYSGTISYNCSSLNTPNLSGTCTPITCSVAGLNISATNNLLSYTSGATNISCATGYTPLNNAQLTYTCTGTSNPGTLTVSSTCVSTTCNISSSTGTPAIKVNRNTAGNEICATNYSGYFSYKCDNNSVGSITVNNCYTGRTFVEKTFSFSIPQQSGYLGNGGGNWGFEYPLTLQTPIDFEYATKVNYNFSSSYSCSSYGSYMNVGLTKKSGTGSIGTLVGGYFEPQPCGGCTISYSPGINNIVGVNVKNNDILAFYLSGYTGCGYVYPNYSATITYMANPSCTFGGSSGIASQTVLGGSSATNVSCGAGFVGTYNYSCGVNGAVSLTSSCTPITCSLSGITGFAGRTVNYTSGASDTIACDAGYTGNLTYSCKSGGTITPTGTCTPIKCSISSFAGISNNQIVDYAASPTSFNCNLSGYTGSINYTCTTNGSAATISGACTPITCTTIAANGYGYQSGLAYTPTAGSGTIICNQTGYSGNANYTCQALGSATITKTCDCATGYSKNGSGACIVNGCSINLVGISQNSIPVGDTILNCGGGYSGTLNYRCANSCDSYYATGYVNANYSGASQNYLPGISYNYPDAINIIGNDTMSSMKVPTGLQVTLYADFLDSAYKILTGNLANFSGSTFSSGVGLDNMVSALRVVKLAECVPQYTATSIGSQSTCSTGNVFIPDWNYSVSNPGGGGITQYSSNSIGLNGPDLGYLNGSIWGYYLANLPSWVTKVSFDWSYYTNDVAGFDPGYFFANGSWQYLAESQNSGTVTDYVINPVADRRFGPGVNSTDSCCGYGVLTLSNIVFK